MTLYAITDKSTGDPVSHDIFAAATFYEQQADAQAQLSYMKDEYISVFEVRAFNVTPQA